MTPFTHSRWKPAAIALGCALMLAACGSGSSDMEDDDDHAPHTHVQTAGRLVVQQGNEARVHVIELDSSAVLHSYTVDHAPTAIYASPGHRYALLVQRPQDAVQILDGGIWQEQHGNHAHDHKQPPALLGARLSGVRPTHYEAFGGQAALFFDGNKDSAAPASVTLLSDASLAKGASGMALATQTLGTYMHGTAEPRGDYLLTTWRDPATTSTLPSQVELHHRHDDHFHFEQRFTPPCPGLHGSYSNATYSAFGCTDGVLLIEQRGSQFSSKKIPNAAELGASRIGTLMGHADWGQFIGIAGHKFFAIDPVAGNMREIAWAPAGVERVTQAVDAQGRNLLVLDKTGTLHILSLADWSKRAEIRNVIANMPTAAPWPALAVSRAAGKAWLSDPNGKQLHAIDLSTARVASTVALTFSPTRMTWLGMPAHKH